MSDNSKLSDIYIFLELIFSRSVASAMIQSDNSAVNVFPNTANETITIEVGNIVEDAISYA